MKKDDYMERIGARCSDLFFYKEKIGMENMPDASTLEQIIIDNAKQQKRPVMGNMELTPLCNLNCDMCYVRLSREEMERTGHLRTADEWLDLARQMEQTGVLFLLLTGGEPLMFPEFKNLYMKLHQMGMILTINTNGTLIDEEWAKFFGKYKPRRINITLYGADEDSYEKLCHYPGGFGKTLQAVRLLREQKIDVKISCSITKVNYGSLEKMFDVGKRMDVPIHIDPYMMPGTRERHQLYNHQIRILPEEAAQASLKALKIQLPEEIYKQYIIQSIEKVKNSNDNRGDGHLSCLAGNCSFTVNWQGEMRPCVMMTEPSVPVFEIGFKRAWEEICSRAQEICISSRCVTCSLRPLCKICAAASFLETGGYDGVPDYLCRYAEELYRLILQEEKNYG